MTPPLRTTLVLLPLTAMVLLAAGCVMEQPVKNIPTDHALAPGSPASPFTTVVPAIPEKTACPAYSYNGSYRIIIDPLTDIRRTPFAINGTTTLPPVLPRNRSLLLMIWPVQSEQRDREQSVLFYGIPYHASVDIREGGDCTNTFSVNVTGLEEKSGDYMAEIGLAEAGEEMILEPRNQTLFSYIRYKN